MLIIFRSHEQGDVTYVGDVAAQLFKCMGVKGSAPGVIPAEGVSQALQKLQRAIANEHPPAPVDGDDSEEEVGIRTRAIPLVNLLKGAEKEEAAVTWQSK